MAGWCKVDASGDITKTLPQAMFDHIILQFVLIFAGAALFATLFLYLKQPIIIAYIVLGIVVGPKG